ncbi:MAG TPA: copper transporter [Nocardioidaceae bacterium]|nr:copper transporter [Nocardioidaceae bacterium]
MTRLHTVVVALSCTLFAVALGIALGAGPLQKDMRDAFRGQPAQAATGAGQQSRTTTLRQVAQYSDDAVTSLAPALLAGRLDDRPVAVLALPGAVDAHVSAVVGDIEAAGGTVTTRLRAGEDLVDPTARTLVDTLSAGQVKEYDNLDVPGDASVYERVGLVMGRALLTKTDGGESVDDAAGSVLNGFTTAGLLTGETPKRRASSLVVVAGPVSGEDETSTARASIVASLARTINKHADGVVVAGPPQAAAAGGAVAAVRADPQAVKTVSTIDTVDTRLGQVGTVLALAEQISGTVGHYGVVDAPDGPMPR